MYESNSDYYSSENRQPTKEELKAKEKEIRAQRKAQNKAERMQKKAARKAKGTGKKIFSTIGLACLFGIVASAVFNFSNVFTKKVVGDNAPQVVDEAPTYNNSLVQKEYKIDNQTTENQNVPEIEETVPEEKKQTVSKMESNGFMNVAQVAENSMPSIVAITSKSVQEVMSMFGAGIQQYEAESAGSGIIVGQNDTELLIVTNAHVVEGANELSVCFSDDEVCPATIKGSEASDDLAVIAVSLSDIGGSTLEQIKVATIGDSDALVIGEQVVAIGNALGYGQSVTTGIVSALNRVIQDSGAGTEYIQTDAAINPGNSGGALLNMNGELVGINSAKLSNTKIEGMGYAIPISAAEPIINNLMNRVTRELVDEKDAGYVGISGFSVTDDVSMQYGIPEGIYVSEVSEGAAADRAGIQKGDIITKFDGMSLDSVNKLRERLSYYRAGETVEITIYRADNGEYVEMNLPITLDGRKGTPLDNSNKAESDSEESGDNQKDRNRQIQPGGDIRDYLYPDGGNLFDFFGR